MFTKIRKRDGRFASFDASKITNALAKAGDAAGEFGAELAHRLMLKVLSMAQDTLTDTPSVEEIQDIVEEVLLS